MRRDQVITIDPAIMDGTPVFAGTRVPVESLVAHLIAGDGIDQFLDGFPGVSRAQAQEFLQMALAAALEDARRAEAPAT